MNAITLIIVALLVFAIAYRYYAKFIAAKVLVLDDSRPTPAFELRDGRDYHPTNKYVLFGHHFAAISGAGPLVGPVLAAQFGFLPGFLWILIGAALGGAVHDMVMLFASVRMKGLSITNITTKYVGKTAGFASGFAVLFIIITALAGLALVVVNALNESAWATFTIALTVPAALFVGLYMYKLRPGKIVEASIIGVLIVIAGIVLGEPLSKSHFAQYFILSKPTLSVLLPVYGFIASVLPVWLLLCPRDYLSSYMKIGTIALLAIGIFVVNPHIQMPAITGFIHGGGPIIPGKVWPFVCITIACGAISGFHALVSTGTTPKMITKESDIVMIGFGSMLIEAVVSILALIAATVMLPGDYFAINLPPALFEKLGYSVSRLPELQSMVGENLSGRAGGAVSLAVGMSMILSSIPGMKTLMGYWYHFAIMFEALFILTTVDTGTRVARYILQEIIRPVNARLSSGTWLPGVLLTGGLISFSWGYLVYNGDISTIWPMFGVANQLLATVALSVGTVFILEHSGNWKYGLITFIPSLFMFFTTVTAGYINITGNYLPKHTVQGNLNAFLSIVMLALVLVVYFESIRKIYSTRERLFAFEGARADKEVNGLKITPDEE
ncbi:MAG TPA: carbon starvation protein A [Elusimicrobia bacterium]|nr:MAG: carbon starvation protein CstA [Elusimicrobia bacterium RIFOXYA12_FULL_49_49]OGS10363.1 MAG: carbon starvation protein CstA [Elusimicrobia bacterium RIFOXYB1_FULL_48_9]OGS16308.1 MAG: carbon starvation protein CstA [Elusimicrobia bacterium RIFOXYA2_FULL_47_53]OGS25852.1 MAG: carbon starvation protein CstA [Elusimicrobia bacterium RIFOXYB12_FULL_50_12]OGS31463.1 MAG: carbon starvation protein CstA [Elusimicrobia bacterium RIFOXYB2_FULL_46_23]HBU70537.1 carbon starvation protein A [Elusi